MMCLNTPGKNCAILLCTLFASGAMASEPSRLQHQREIHHISNIDMPYDRPQRPITLPAQRPRPDAPYYYHIEERHYYEPGLPQNTDDEGEYITDEYNNCYQVKYEQGFRTLVDVRSKLCR